ncbi:MAG: hypothetical protein P8X79_22580 [Reinekea sp.]
MLPKNWGEPMGAPAILLHPASTLESRIQDDSKNWRVHSTASLEFLHIYRCGGLL